MKGWQTKLSGAGLTLLLSGCSAIFGPEEVGPACPNVALLADAAHQTHYADGPGRDLTDIAYQADLTGITGECRYDFDDAVGRNPTKVTVLMNLALKAVIGPASKTRHVDLTYFVAIVDPKHKVLARQEFSLPVDFQDAKGAYFGKDQLEQEIPLGPKDKGAGFQVLVGLKLDQDEVDRNRAKRKTQ